MSKSNFAEGEYFHLYNRGVEKRLIFLDDEDRWRFVTLLLIFQSHLPIQQINRLTKNVQHRRLDKDIFKEIYKNRYIDLIAFCLMPNHFHLIVSEVKEGGISKFMQRLSDAYTKYFNIKYNRTGHLFGGKFQNRHIDNNEYLNYLSTYIHLNPRELENWHHKEIKYPWSSFQDYAQKNRWHPFLNPNIIMSQFNNNEEYRIFVEKTPIKEIEDNLERHYLID